jgi:RNA polymerase sigma factor (sigma-70 family)
VRAGWTESRRLHGDLGLAPEAFAEDVLRQGHAHWARQGVEADIGHLVTYASRAALCDLVLASACERRLGRAWDLLAKTYATRLEGFAVRRGLSSHEAESVVQDLLGDLSAPPPRGSARTLLGTYDATGSLFGWLSVVLLRRIAGQARKRKVASLEAQDADVREAAAPAGRTPHEPPALDQLLDREAAQRLTAAVAWAWTSLSAQERFALVLKHRDDRSQREIAALLGVGSARVSRVVSSAVARLTEGVQQALGASRAPQAGSALWQALTAALATHLASQGPQSPPTQGTGGGRAGRAASSRAPEDNAPKDWGQA